ncbi:MAG: hypothetical protein ACREEK_19980 [Bradyrhizobium sp.]
MTPAQKVERALTVVEGTERLLLELVPDASTDSAWVNLYPCESGKCIRHGDMDVNGRHKRIVVDNPKAGAWETVATHYCVSAFRSSSCRMNAKKKIKTLS